jgi:hypothetical protein
MLDVHPTHHAANTWRDFFIHSANRLYYSRTIVSGAGPSWEIYGHWRPEWNTGPSQIRTDVFYQLAS